MKKLTYLFLALLIVACSSDDSNNDDGNQLFLEKYDSIVFEAEWATSDNTYKIAFVNSTNVTTYELSSSDGDENCESRPIEGTFDEGNGVTSTFSIQGETENSITVQFEYFYEGELENTGVDVYTVTFNGDVYKLEHNNDNPPYLSTDDELCF